MTVKELINELKKHNQDLEVVIDADRWLDVTSIKEDDNGGIQRPVVVID